MCRAARRRPSRSPGVTDNLKPSASCGATDRKPTARPDLTRLRPASLLLAGESIEDLGGGFGDNVATAFITLRYCRYKSARLLQGHMRRQRRDFGVGLHFEHHRTVAG